MIPSAAPSTSNYARDTVRAKLDVVNCAQLRICSCCRLIPIKATDRAAVGIPLSQPAS